MGKSCVSCCKILAVSFPHLSGGVETRTNVETLNIPLLGPQVVYHKDTQEETVLDLKFKLDSMLTQGTAGLREHSSKRSLLRRRLEFSIVSIELNMPLKFKGSYNQMTRHLSEHKYQCNVCQWSLYSPFTATVASPPLTCVCGNFSLLQQFLLIATVTVCCQGRGCYMAATVASPLLMGICHKVS